MDVVYQGLTQIFHEVFDDETIVLQPHLTTADIKAWDSFRHVEILIAIQDRFRLKFSSHEIDGLTCVGDLVEVIRRKRAS